MIGFNFPNQVRTSNYPFTDNSTLMTTDRLKLAAGVIADAAITAEAGANVYLSYFVKRKNLIQFVLGVNSLKEAMTGMLNLIKPDIVALYNRDNYRVGTLKCGSLNELKIYPDGQYDFSTTAAVFLPFVILPVITKSVYSLTANNNKLIGDVVIEAGTGVTIEQQNINKDQKGITINFVGQALDVTAIEQVEFQAIANDEVVASITCTPDKNGVIHLSSEHPVFSATPLKIEASGNNLYFQLKARTNVF